MPYTITLKNGDNVELGKIYNYATATIPRTGTASLTIIDSGFIYTYHTGYWTLGGRTLWRGGDTNVGLVTPTVLGDGGYAYDSAVNAVQAERGVISPDPPIAYRLSISSGGVESAPMKPMGGATAAPSVVADGVVGSAAMTLYALTTFTAGAVAAAYSANKITRRKAAFARWVFSTNGARTSLTRNTAASDDSNTRVSTASTLTLTWHGDGFTITGGSKKSCTIANFYAYCLFADAANVAPAFSFNQQLAVALVTVSVWQNGVYTPFTRASAADLDKYCTAFTVNEFNILADQTGSFYPKNCCVSPENQTLAVTFTPKSPYRVRGWATAAVRPSQPSSLDATGVYSVTASAMNGLHVYVASETDAFGLLVREAAVTDVLPSGFTAEPVTRCTLDGVVYATPVSITRKGFAAFTASAVFTENETAITNQRNMPGAVPAVLVNAGAGFAEYTAGALASSSAEYGAYPVYVPAYKQAASNLALDVSLAGSALASAVVLSARQGSVTVADPEDALPLAAAPCWAGALAKGLPVVLELSLGFVEGVVDTDVAFSVTGIDNATVAWATSPVYGQKIATVSFSLDAVTASTADLVLRGDQIVNPDTLTPEVSLESSVTAGTLTHTVTGVYPVAASPVFGGLTINTPFTPAVVSPATPGTPLPSVNVTVTRVAGYTPHRVEVVAGATVRGFRLVGATDETFEFPTGLQDADDGADVTVRLVVRADVCVAPVVAGAVPSIDNGLFAATLANLTDTVSNLWHVGDRAELTVTPAVRNTTAFPGLAVFNVTYNGVEVPLGSDDKLVVPLDNSGIHVVAVAMAGSATLATAEDGGGEFPVSPTTLDTPPTLAMGGVTVVRGGVTYYRLGSDLTLTIPPTTNSKTAVYVRHESVLLEDGFGNATLADYAYAGTLVLTLKGNDTVTVFYATGVSQPWVSLAVFDYSENAYVLANRPVCGITAVPPHVLGPNEAFTASKPADLTPPDNELTPKYWDAVNVVAQMASLDVLPAVRVTVTAPTTPYLLERWDVNMWRPANAGSGGVTLPDTTFFRLSRGYRADQTVTFTVAAAVDTDGTPLVQRPNVSALVSGYWDHTGAPPFSQPVPKGFSVSLFAFGVTGYRFKEWRYSAPDNSVAASSQACQIDVGLAPVSVYPVYEESDGAYSDVMVLSGGQDTEAGLWVSKEFRAQFPWSPVVAAVVRGVHEGLCRLIVRNGRSQRTAREDVEADSPDNVAITVSDDGMRRVPTPAGGMSRFHRVALLVTGGEVASVSVASGAQTLKGGH